MRKIYSFMFAVLAFAGLAQAQVVFDATVTLGQNTTASGADEVSKDGITISTTSGGLGTGQQYRFAKSSQTTFTSTVGNISAIVFTCTASDTEKYGPGCFADQNGYTYDGKIGTWTGSAVEVNFTAETAQVRATKIEVYLNGEKPDPVDPTPTIDWTSSADAPLTVAVALEKAAKLGAGEESDKEVYVKGIISQIEEVETEQYGNANYYISDDGNSGTQFYVYHGFGLGGEKFTSPDDIEEGDDVIVVGIIKNYVKDGVSTLEITKSKLYSHNGTTYQGGDNPQPKGDGSLDNPFNAVAATAAATALGSGNTSSESYYIKGKISEIKYSFDAEHGTATFSISDDGTTANQFLCYGVYYLGNRAWKEGDDQISVGNDVIIYGQLTNYNGTPETASKKACLYSLNGKTDNGDLPGPKIDWTSSATAPLTVAAAQEKAAQLGGGEKSDVEVYVKGKISQIDEVYLEKGNATYYISDDGTTNGQFYVYRGKYLGGADFTSEDAIAVGNDVIVVGTITNYVNKDGESTLEFTAGNRLYSLNGKTEGGDDPKPTELRDAPIDNPYSVAELIGIVAESTKDNVQEDAWVKGFIVGYINGSSLKDGTAIFSANAPEGTDKDGNPLTVTVSNILIADMPDANTVAAVAPIALQNNSDARADLNLADNPGKLGTQVWLKGNIRKYMGVTGLREVKQYSLDGFDAIHDLNIAATDEVVYNLAGQRVKSVAKAGIYIVGSKKVVIK